MAKSTRIKHAVVLINFKDASVTANCVRSIEACYDAPHVIVVDNGSSAECVAELRRAIPDLDLVVGENVGYSAANNIGIKKALGMGAEVIYILNNDTLVDSNLFYKAYRYVAGKKRITGGKIYYAKGYEYHDEQKGKGNVLWFAGGYIDWKAVIARHYGVDEVDRGQFDTVKQVEFVTGCFIAIPKVVFQKIGMFDERFFLYLEDADFCLRAKKAGVEVLYNPHLIVYHCNSSSTISGSPLVDYYITRNRFVIGKRYGSLRLTLALVKEAVTRNWDSPIRRTAFFDFLTGRMGNQNDKVAAIVAKMDK